ncbi:MAG: DUF3108 domain-containing protein [Rubrivivax sp.]|nr:DUF3108 domain-containing protein [Rubrivivax sp.]
MGSFAARPPAAAAPGRLVAGLALVAGVTALHLWLAEGVFESRLADGAAEPALRRIQVAFVRELQPAAPPPPPPAPVLRRLPAAAAALPAAPAASAPVLEPAPPLAEEAVAALPAELPALATPLPAPPPEPAAAAASAPDATTFEWPPSTRLSYTLTGHYRGPVEGQASVEWLLSGSRYQVHVEVSIGPSFAPLMSRRISSEGEITPAGLSPWLYDETTRVALRDPVRRLIRLDAGEVRLPGGQVLPRPDGVQDSASQFVQMTWLFTTQPQRLQPGQTVEFPLALPRRVETWSYDVIAHERLFTPAGEVDAVHVRPRREAGRGGDLVAEMWVAPTLQYLPVRIVIRQDAENFVDLTIDRLPLQAAQPPR